MRTHETRVHRKNYIPTENVPRTIPTEWIPRVNLSETGQNAKPTSAKEDYWSVTDASAYNIHTPLCAPTLLCRSWSSLRPPFFLASLRPTIARYSHQGLALQLQSLAIFKL
ncbi:hypothetical protein F2Q70_00039459 [Brassica cretica]|uniref:Uncharacterized protein n=1 Tax=Brassica cretica TaxID=69181 RepID=A0A8S9K6L8_BRACR|nr:hypothetical protein F2Q70_00039459 [Brassica cretica]